MSNNPHIDYITWLDTYTFCLVAVHFTSYRKVCTCTKAWLGVRSNECCTWAQRWLIQLFRSVFLLKPSGSICLAQACTVQISGTSVTTIMLSNMTCTRHLLPAACTRSCMFSSWTKCVFMLTYRAQSALFIGTTYWHCCGLWHWTLCSEGLFVVTPHQ